MDSTINLAVLLETIWSEQMLLNNICSGHIVTPTIDIIKICRVFKNLVITSNIILRYFDTEYNETLRRKTVNSLHLFLRWILCTSFSPDLISFFRHYLYVWQTGMSVWQLTQKMRLLKHMSPKILRLKIVTLHWTWAICT